MLLAELGHDVAGVDFAPETLDGRPPGELREVLAREGLRDVEYESLMDPELWGGSHTTSTTPSPAPFAVTIRPTDVERRQPAFTFGRFRGVFSTFSYPVAGILNRIGRKWRHGNPPQRPLRKPYGCRA
jgi:hypothetical protein